MYKKHYKKGSYGSGLKMTQNKRLANQQKARYAMTIAASRGGAPLANRGFGSMTIAANRERKFYDIDSGTVRANTTGAFSLLSVPVLGSDFTNRIGRKILNKSLYIRGRVTITSAVTGAVNTIGCQQARMIIVVDNQPNGAAPATTDLLKQSLVESQLNANNRDRFKVIKDKTFIFEPYINVTTATQAQSAVNRASYDIKCYKKLNVETIFNGTNGGTIGDVNSGAIYMFWIGSNIAGGSDVSAILTTRIRFDDS